MDQNNQFQPTTLCGDANVTVAQQAANRAGRTEHNHVHTMNNREWTDEEKIRIVCINLEERQKGKGFMKRIKDQWDGEFPEKKRTAQNMVDNASRFEKEGWGGEIVWNQTTKIQKNTEWSTEMKISLIIIDEEQRYKGSRFMKRVKERWDAKHPEHATASMQKLRDNASRFKKDHEIMNLMLVRKRTEVNRQNENESQVETEQQENPTNGIPLEALKESVEKDEDKELPVQIKAEDEELERLFTHELQHMVCNKMSELEPREKLHKLVLPSLASLIRFMQWEKLLRKRWG